MARIVNLGLLLPEDIEFQLPDGSSVVAPGDPPLQMILKIANLFEQIGEEDVDEDGAAEVGVSVLQQLDDEVLALLRMRDETIERSPFGVFGVQYFVAELMKAYNMAAGEEEEDPPTPPTPKPRAKATTKK